MGLFDKLKNVLFEEEEVEEETVKPIEQQEEEEIEKLKLPKINRNPQKKEEPKEYDVEEETDRELFNVDKTFDFPNFDEDEFDEFLPKKEEPKKEKPTEYVRPSRISALEPKKEEYKPHSRVASIIPTTTQRVEESSKVFRPSPVISPVYGILDKNYKKEDVLTRDELEKSANANTQLDVDSVRKKAFGTLEEDLVKKQIEEPAVVVEEVTKTIELPKVEELKVETPIEEEIEKEVLQPEIVEEELLEDTTNLDDLLDKTVDMEIEVTQEMELPSRMDEKDYTEMAKEEVEEELKLDEPLKEEVINEEVVEEKEDEVDESDLFELIDSMYESGDDE